MEDLVAERIDLIIGDQVTSLAQIRGGTISLCGHLQGTAGRGP
jgi:hypothetical protein